MDTTEVRPIAPSLSTEVSMYDLERMAYAMQLTIDLPGADGGWARIRTERGARYHAWTPRVSR